jgi:hypothetical protein
MIQFSRNRSFRSSAFVFAASFATTDRTNHETTRISPKLNPELKLGKNEKTVAALPHIYFPAICEAAQKRHNRSASVVVREIASQESIQSRVKNERNGVRKAA